MIKAQNQTAVTQNGVLKIIRNLYTTLKPGRVELSPSFFEYIHEYVRVSVHTPTLTSIMNTIIVPAAATVYIL